jgi:cobalt-zinc-cadmium efflux system protein
MFWVLLLTGGFMVVEAVGGWLAGSLALIADAGHMLSDTAALALAWAAFRVARRPHDEKRTYGYHRFEILAAFANGLALFAIAAWICFEAVGRLREPVPVLGVPMLVVACAGLAVNLVALFVLRGGNRANLNVRAALLHVIGDLLGSIGAIAAAIVILATGWTPIDPILSALIAVLILRGAWDITRRAGHVLMEGAPEGFDAAALRLDLINHVAGVGDVHHVHAWLISAERPMVTLHLELAPGADSTRVLPAVKARLREAHGFGHSTIQIEQGHCPD